MTKYLILFFLISFNFVFPANSFTSVLGQKYKIYNPNWSIKDNGGSLPLGVLAPYNSKESIKNKIPIILIHGTVSEFRPYCNWKNFLNEIEKPQNKKFKEKHSIYIFKYASNTSSFENTAQDLRNGLKELLSEYPEKTKYKIIISSLGGKLFCLSVKDDLELKEKLDKGISLGVPFWGTPLLSKELIIEKSSSNNKFLNLLISGMTNTLFPELISQLTWILPINNNTNNSIENTCSAFRSKLINYSAFIKSPLSEDKDVKQEEINEWLIGKISHSDYKHAWDTTMHYKMGWEIEQNIGSIYLFRFNDGLVPIYSSLWLNPNLNHFEGEKELNTKNLQIIKKMNNKARLFKNLDHSDLTSGEIDYEIKDLLGNSKKTINAFILSDLN